MVGRISIAFIPFFNLVAKLKHDIKKTVENEKIKDRYEENYGALLCLC